MKGIYNNLSTYQLVKVKDRLPTKPGRYVGYTERGELVIVKWTGEKNVTWERLDSYLDVVNHEKL